MDGNAVHSWASQAPAAADGGSHERGLAAVGMARSRRREGGNRRDAAEQGVAAVGEVRTLGKAQPVKRIAGTDAGPWGGLESLVRGRRRS